MGGRLSLGREDSGLSGASSVALDKETSGEADADAQEPSASMDITTKFKSLLGNTDKLSASAQKLFALGKMYMTGKAGDKTQSDGFPALFQALPEKESTDPDHKNEGQEITSSHHSLGETTTSSSNKGLASVHHSLENHFPFTAKPVRVQCAQTYVQWKAANDLANLNFLCFSSSSKTMYLQPLDDFPDMFTNFQLCTDTVTLSFFEMLQGFLQLFFFGMEVAVLPPIPVDQAGWKVKSRCHPTTKQKQYCVTDIFPYLQTLLPSNGHSIIGVVWTDLYPEKFNFVLGEASYTHKSAVVSFGRYEPNGYDGASHQDVLEINGQVIWKLLRTLSHEVCHLFSFSHCTFFHCAMNESSSMSQALSQPLFLCPVCLRKLQQACGFEVLERYQLLLKFMQNINNQFPDSAQIKDSIIWLEKCIAYLAP